MAVASKQALTIIDPLAEMLETRVRMPMGATRKLAARNECVRFGLGLALTAKSAPNLADSARYPTIENRALCHGKPSR